MPDRKVMSMPWDLASVLEEYDTDQLTLATVCSHSSLQIFNGARKEGIRTIGLCVGPPPRYYEAFPLGRPDEFLSLASWADLPGILPVLRKKNAVLVPHGSFVEYVGTKRFAQLEVPVFGNRDVLEWESNRTMERQWLTSAGLRMPAFVEDPRDIVKPVIVKYHGAKGGRGFFIAKSFQEFQRKIKPDEPYTIQEFVLGTRYYLHYFYSPVSQTGYRVRDGALQLMSIDRRDETNIDEAHRLGSIRELEDIGIPPSFVVTGNIPMVIRESLLPKVFDMGARTVTRAYEMFGGLWGPFCLETVVTEDLEFTTFEISGRIVAGTNPFVSGSPYADLVQPGVSTGQRIAQELRLAAKDDRLEAILS